MGATDRGGKVVLAWIRDERFAVVRVYRSVGEEGEAFEPIGETRENSFTDETVESGRSYRYRLAALGADGSEGRRSAEMSVRLKVKALRPPAVPVWEGHLPVEGGVGLKWADQEGADIIVYNVYRSVPPDTEFQLIASVRGTSHLDTRVEPGRTYVYALSALDSSFRETPLSDRLSVTLQAARPPAEKKEIPDWRARRTRLVAEVSQGDQPLLRPADVAVGTLSGNVYLSDSGTNRIMVFTAAGRFLRSLGAPPGSPNAFRKLLGLAVDDAETVYAVDAAQGAVFAFAAGTGAGRRLEIAAPAAAHAAGLVDCVAGLGGRLALVDNTNNRVLLEAGTPAARLIGAAGSGPGQFSAPTFGALDGAMNLYVTDTLNGRIQVFSPAGEFVRSFGRSERGQSLLGRPKGIAVRPNGEVLVADSWLNAVGVFDAAGQPLAILVDEEGKPLDLGSPNGIALGADNRIYIAERLSARLQIREIIDDAR